MRIYNQERLHDSLGQMPRLTCLPTPSTAGLSPFDRVFPDSVRSDGHPPLRVTMAGMLIGLACFSLFNVTFRRPWRWPGLAVSALFIAIAVVRIAFGP